MPAVFWNFSPVRCATVPLPGDAEVHLARLRLRGGDEVGERLVRRLRRHDEDEGRARDEADRRQVLHRVVRQLRVERRIDREVARLAEDDRVAVGRRLGRLVDAEVAAGAGLVVDDEGPAGLGRDALRHLAGDDVGAAAGRERHEHADRLGGVGLREGEAAGEGGGGPARRGESGSCCLRLGVAARGEGRCRSGYGMQCRRRNRYSPIDSFLKTIHGTFAIMDLRDLRYFEVIAGHQHMGRASAQLHRTQPALTSAVRRLEEDTGMPLFERAGRGIKLSPAGEVLLKWARRMRFDVDDAKRELRALQGGMSGQVRLGIVPTAAQFLLPSAARAAAPRGACGDAAHRRRPRRHAASDAARGRDRPPRRHRRGEEKGMVSRVLAEDAIVVAASATHPLFKAARPTLKDLTRYRWALQPPGAPTRDWLDHTFDRRRLPRPDVQVESTMLLMLPALIAETGSSASSRAPPRRAQAGQGPARDPARGGDDAAAGWSCRIARAASSRRAAERLIALLEEAGEAG
jgi:DNA-binding transcriptional LysR family regulator